MSKPRASAVRERRTIADDRGSVRRARSTNPSAGVAEALLPSTRSPPYQRGARRQQHASQPETCLPGAAVARVRAGGRVELHEPLAAPLPQAVDLMALHIRHDGVVTARNAQLR